VSVNDDLGKKYFSLAQRHYEVVPTELPYIKTPIKIYASIYQAIDPGDDFKKCSPLENDNVINKKEKNFYVLLEENMDHKSGDNVKFLPKGESQFINAFIVSVNSSGITLKYNDKTAFIENSKRCTIIPNSETNQIEAAGDYIFELSIYDDSNNNPEIINAIITTDNSYNIISFAPYNKEKNSVRGNFLTQEYGNYPPYDGSMVVFDDNTFSIKNLNIRAFENMNDIIKKIIEKKYSDFFISNDYVGFNATINSSETEKSSKNIDVDLNIKYRAINPASLNPVKSKKFKFNSDNKVFGLKITKMTTKISNA
jgi:hypothetical protein